MSILFTLRSFAPHDISVILQLLGEEPDKVSAFGDGYLNKHIYDTTLTTLEFRNGVKGHIFVSWLHPYKEQKLIVVGSEAMVVFDDLNQEKLCIYPHQIKWKDGKIPTANKADYYAVPLEDAEPLKQELKHFIECIKERKTPETDGVEGVRVLKVLQQAEESLSKVLPRVQHEIPSYPDVSERSSMTLPVERSTSGNKCFVHKSSVLDENVEIGEETKIWHFSHVLRDSKIGSQCIIGQNVMIGPEVEIGDKCKIQNNVSIYKGVTIENEVFCGPSCVFTNVYNPRAFIERKHEFMQTLVKKGATIGANATVICGATIGRYAMIGAGAVVKTDVLDHAIVAGVPAKQIGWACRCGTTLKFSAESALCAYCVKEYILEDNKLIIVSK